jgi:hypothetical protein
MAHAARGSQLPSGTPAKPLGRCHTTSMSTMQGRIIRQRRLRACRFTGDERPNRSRKFPTSRLILRPTAEQSSKDRRCAPTPAPVITYIGGSAARVRERSHKACIIRKTRTRARGATIANLLCWVPRPRLGVDVSSIKRIRTPTQNRGRGTRKSRIDRAISPHPRRAIHSS